MNSSQPMQRRLRRGRWSCSQEVGFVLSSPLQRAVDNAVACRLRKAPHRKTSTASGRAHREAILACFKEFSARGVFPPAFDELMEATGLKSTATVSHHVGVLVKEGKLCKHRKHYVLVEDAEADRGQS